MTATAERADAVGTLEHDAFFYASDDEYVTGVVGFIREGLERDEPLLVSVPGWNLDLLHGALTPDEFTEISEAEAMARRSAGF